jgi:hypothetical protein
MSTYSYMKPVLEIHNAVHLVVPSVAVSTYSYLEPVLEVLHAVSIVVPPVAVYLRPLLVVHLVPHIVVIPSLARRS